MNKISKKIVSLVTMAAFALTLVPAAAFAADDSKYVNNGVDIQKSEIYAVENGVRNDNISVDQGENVTLKFAVNDSNGVGLLNTNLATEQNKVKVWAYNTDTEKISTAVEFTGDGVSKCNATGENVYMLLNAQNGTEVTATFKAGGHYKIFAGVGDFTSAGELTTIATMNSTTTVTVDALPVTTTVIQFDQVAGDYKDGSTANISPNKDFIVNGIDTETISGVAYTDQTGNNFAANQTFELSTNRPDIVTIPDSVSTNNVGHFSFEYAVSKVGTYKIYMSNDDIKVTITIKAGTADLTNIKTISSDAQTLLAGNDKNYKDNTPENFADAVQFEITDKYGDVVEDADLSAEPAATTGTDHDKYITIEAKGDKSDLKSENLTLVWDKTVKAYTLKYDGSNPSKDLVPGEYTVKVGLLSGQTATATFTLAKYGTTQDLNLKLQAKNYGTSDAEYVNITDEIALGQDLKVIPMYVDENGIQIKADPESIKLGVDGRGVTKYDQTAYPNQYNVGDEESLIGSLVYVKAFDSSVKKYVETQLTIVDDYNTYSLAFDPVEGEVNTNNVVNVSVVDDQDKVASTINGEVMAYVASQSNADANIEVTVNNSGDVSKGKAEITVFSDKETTADIVVAVKAGTAIYGSTLEYTFGAEDINADTTVVMTIGSSDYVVNNDIVTGDAAPYVDSNWRTMVPFRVLGETFGATVNWNEDDQTVTYTLGDTEIVMTIGEDTYTVNGEEKTMDTAPVIQDSRTMVPVRFVAEALGYTVTPLQDANGLTASVVFQK